MAAGNTSGLTYHMYKMGIEEALRSFREMGFTEMEVGHTHSLKVLKKFSDSMDFRSYHHYTKCRLDTGFDELVDELERPLEIAEALDIECLSFHPFYKNSFKTAVENLDKLRKKVEPELLIENATAGSENRLVTTPDDFKRVLDLGCDVGLLLDVGHCFRNGLEEFLSFKDSIREVHLQDAFSKKDEIHHLPLGAGEMDFGFLEELVDKFWVLELKWATKELLEISRMKAERMRNSFG